MAIWTGGREGIYAHKISSTKNLWKYKKILENHNCATVTAANRTETGVSFIPNSNKRWVMERDLNT